MLSLGQFKNLIAGNAILAAALRDSDISIVYPQAPEISEDRLFGTWKIQVLVVDSDIRDMVLVALVRAGFEVVDRSTIEAEYQFPITPAQRAEMERKDQAAKEAAAARKASAKEQALLELIEELRQEVADLREDVDIQALLKTKAGPPGPTGRPGRDGRDGQDLLATEASLGDLQDVSGEPPTNGHVLTWIESAGEWQPKPTQTFSSVSGGGGGGGGGGPSTGAGLEHWTETPEGHLLPNAPGQNLGSPDAPIAAIYVEGQTVYLDDKPLSLNAQGRLEFDGNQLAYGDVVLPPDGSGIEEAPIDGKHYVRKDAAWVTLESALAALGYTPGGGPVAPQFLDGGDLSSGTSQATSTFVADGGDVGDGSTASTAPGTFDGGVVS